MRPISVATVAALIAAAAAVAVAFAVGQQKPAGGQIEPKKNQTEAPGAQKEPPATPEKETAETPAAAAQGPDHTTESFGDWSIVCTDPRGAGERNCEVDTSIVLRGQSAPFARIAVVRPAKGKPVQLIAVVPVNIATASPVKITADPGKTEFTLPLRYCVPGGCVAVAELSNEDLQTLSAAGKSPGQLALVDASGKSAAPQFSLQGLDEALESYLKRQK